MNDSPEKSYSMPCRISQNATVLIWATSRREALAKLERCEFDELYYDGDADGNSDMTAVLLGTPICREEDE